MKFIDQRKNKRIEIDEAIILDDNVTDGSFRTFVRLILSAEKGDTGSIGVITHLSPQTASNHLKILENAGYITYSDKTLTILDKDSPSEIKMVVEQPKKEKPKPSCHPDSKKLLDLIIQKTGRTNINYAFEMKGASKILEMGYNDLERVANDYIDWCKFKKSGFALYFYANDVPERLKRQKNISEVKEEWVDRLENM